MGSSPDQNGRAVLLPMAGDLLTEITAPVHDGARGLYRLWQQLKPADGLPARDDFTFERLAALGILGNCFVIEPLDDGRDWRYRLLGSHITWLFGADVTNMPFSRHFDPDEAELCIRLSNRVARTRQPVFLAGSFRTGDFSGQLETMSLPVFGRGSDTVWLVGATFPSDRQR